MEVIYWLIPLSILLVALIIGFFIWSVQSDQFEDLEGPAHRILQDDDQVGKKGQNESDSNPLP